MASPLFEAWMEAERVAKNVHLSKRGEGQYYVQLNRQACVCERCWSEAIEDSPATALREAIARLEAKPLHITSESR